MICETLQYVSHEATIAKIKGLYHYEGPDLYLFDTQQSIMTGRNVLIHGSMFVVLNVKRWGYTGPIQRHNRWDFSILTRLGTGYFFLYSEDIGDIKLDGRKFLIQNK